MATRGRRELICLVGITAAALAIRWYGLGRVSFWWDEAISAYMAEAGRLDVWMVDTHPPLYYALLSAWRLASDQDAWLRFPSVIFGVATVPIVYALGAALFSRTAGLWAAALLAVTYVHVLHSREARMYTLMIMLFAGALWGLVVGARQERRLGWVVYALCGTLLTYTHALGPLYVAVLAALLPFLAARRGRWSAWRPWAVSSGAVALLFLPALLALLARTEGVRDQIKWMAAGNAELPMLATLRYLTVEPIPAVSAFASRLGLPVSPFFGRWMWFAPVIVVLAWILLRAGGESADSVRLLVLAYALPIAILAAVSAIVQPVLIPRAVLPTVVPVVLLLGAGVDVLSTRRLMNHVVLGVIAGILTLGTIAYLRSADAKSQWREAVAYLGEQAGAGDLLLIDTDDQRVPPYFVCRYDAGKHLGGLAQLSVPRILGACRSEVADCLERAFASYQPGQVVWVIRDGGRPLLKGRTAAQAWLDANLEVLDVRHFSGVDLERRRLTPPGRSVRRGDGGRAQYRLADPCCRVRRLSSSFFPVKVHL